MAKKTPVMRVHSDFKELCDRIKKENKGLKLSDPQASKIVTDEFYNKKIFKQSKGGLL